MNTLRNLLLVALVILLAYLCLQVDQGRLKGLSLEPWRLAPTIGVAFFLARFAKHKLHPVSAVGLGGIGGALGTLDPAASVYGVFVGLIAAAIATLIPRIRKAQTGDSPRH